MFIHIDIVDHIQNTQWVSVVMICSVATVDGEVHSMADTVLLWVTAFHMEDMATDIHTVDTAMDGIDHNDRTVVTS